MKAPVVISFKSPISTVDVIPKSTFPICIKCISLQTNIQAFEHITSGKFEPPTNPPTHPPHKLRIFTDVVLDLLTGI